MIFYPEHKFEIISSLFDKFLHTIFIDLLILLKSFLVIIDESYFPAFEKYFPSSSPEDDLTIIFSLLNILITLFI